MDQLQILLGKHFEKVIIGAAIAVFAAALVMFVVMRESKDEVLRNDVAGDVEKIKTVTGAPSIEKAVSPDELATLGIGQPGIGAADFQRQLSELPPAAVGAKDKDWVPGQATGTIVEPGEKVVVGPPEKIFPAEDIQMAIGRGTTNEVVPSAIEKIDVRNGAVYDIAWAGVVGKFDLTAAIEEFAKGNAKPQDVIITKVEIQRRERKADGTWTEWKPVDPSIPAAVAAKWPKPPANPKDLRAVGAWYNALKAQQAEVRRASMYKLLATDSEGQTVEAVGGTAKDAVSPKWPAAEPAEGEAAVPAAASAPAKASALAKAPGGGPSFLDDVTTAAKPGDLPGMAEPAKAENILTTLWANDVEVVPGHTYQYQMRVTVFNPVYADQRVTDEKVRMTLELTSAWSKPGREVTIPGLVHVYFVGMFGEKVNLEIHRWIAGQWVIVPSAPSLIGTSVSYIRKGYKLAIPGGKEEVVHDIKMDPDIFLVDVIRNFPFQPVGGNKAIRTNVLVFADALAQLGQRIEFEDRTAATNARLQRSGEKKPSPPTPKTTTTKPPAPKPRPTR